MLKYYKEVVGERQMYRRVDNEVSHIKAQLPNVNLFLDFGGTKENLNSSYTNPTVQVDSCNNQNQESFLNGCENECKSPPNNESLLESLTRNVSHDRCDTLVLHETKATQTLESLHNLQKELRLWALRNKISHSAITDLLHVLAPLHCDLPLSSKTLLCTPHTAVTRTLNTGEYIHFGLENFLKVVLSKHTICVDSKVKISINIDGLPLFKSSSTQFWPILGMIVNKNMLIKKPFAIGVYCGKGKPFPLSDYLEDFVDEISRLTKEGIDICGRRYSIQIEHFICDAPARAFIKCVKSHSGYSSCDKCTEPGDYVKGRVIVSAPRRDDSSFLLQIDEDHHLGISPLLKLNIAMVSKFPIDYMHCLCLGVMRKLLNSWTSGSLRVRLSSKSVNLISETH